MLKVRFLENDEIITTQTYEADPDTYRGQIVCYECGEKAWHKRAYANAIRECTACFVARHKEGCEASSLIVLNEDDGTEEPVDPNQLYVDLDKSKSNIYVAQPSEKHNDQESDWKTSKVIVGGSGGQSSNRSLRQILNYINNNEGYIDDDKEILIVADSGVPILSGKLKEVTARLDSLPERFLNRRTILYGTINNVKLDSSKALWLNTGNPYHEPAILVEKGYVKTFLSNFKLKSAEALAGAKVIIVGTPWTSSTGKIVVKLSFTKYISFRKATYVEKDAATVTV